MRPNKIEEILAKELDVKERESDVTEKEKNIKEYSDKLDEKAKQLSEKEKMISEYEKRTMADIKAEEEFIKGIKESIDNRTKEIATKEIELSVKENAYEKLFISLENKQGLIASRIAHDESILSKNLEAIKDLEEKKSITDIRIELLSRKEKEIGEKNLFLQKEQDRIQAMFLEASALKATLDLKNKELQAKEAELSHKEGVIKDLNFNLNLQKRENEALQKKIQRLITLNKLEQEVA